MSLKLMSEFKQAIPRAMRRRISDVVRRRETGDIVVQLYKHPEDHRRYPNRFPEIEEEPLVPDFEAAIALFVLRYSP